jgi:indole-3-glycerol phosphate synthase
VTGAFVETGTVLDRILARTAADVAVRKASVPFAVLEQRASNRAKPLSFRQAIDVPGTSVIAEFKRASPSRGRFPVEIEPTHVVSEYLDGGSAALSVLTDEPFFQGSMADLTVASIVAHERNAPVLRKDFILDEYQLIESLAIGADAVLLIVGALDDSSLKDLLAKARAYGLDALVEVHDEAEMQRAIEAGAEIIGVNNRDLRTFEVDLKTTERISSLLPYSAVLVGESGIFTREDVLRLEAAGVDAVLVGESLIVAPNRAEAIRQLRGEA